jgi:hypothetical protein
VIIRSGLSLFVLAPLSENMTRLLQELIVEYSRLTVTAGWSHCQSSQATSFVGLPILNVPGGMNTMFVGAANTEAR